MALLPILLDMVDDFHGIEKRRCPVMFVPHSRGLQTFNFPTALQKIPQTPDEFQTTINVQSFKPEEISVKVKGREIFIEGKHEEREDENGFISRQFTRRYILPEAYDMDTVATYLDADGKMVVKAQKPKAVEGPQERVIPIERVASEEKKVAQNGVEHGYKLEDVME